ncbi:MAG: MFS transporter [Microbacteriaceae bacterium]|nr:MFS transporter [Microbacteriaceae bacterium]
MNSTRSWLVWGAAVLAYTVAVLQRTSLGVAGIDATHRFDVSAAALSSLAVVQLIVYAVLQIPVGVLLDRFGPRALLVTGALLMAVGQTFLALASSIEWALVGRVLVGAGDALTFISVIRLLSNWFSGRLLPQVAQWTGNIGQLGQVLSAIPFSFVLHTYGWPPAFLSVATMSLLSAGVVLALVRNTLHPVENDDTRPSWPEAMRILRQSLTRPGTQLGFWSHFVTQSSGTMLTLLWGFPLLTAGLGYSRSDASLLLSLIVGVGAVAGPIIGVLTARYPMRRSNLVLAIVAGIGMAWTAVLAWPGHPPLWLIIVLIATLGVGGPGSLIGFDFARTFNPKRSLGSANGVVNVGGFLASFVMMYLVGVILDVLNQSRIDRGLMSEVFSWDSFRIALLVQYLVVGAGVGFLLRVRRRVRRQLHQDEGITVAPLWIAVSRMLRRGGRSGP